MYAHSSLVPVLELVTCLDPEVLVLVVADYINSESAHVEAIHAVKKPQATLSTMIEEISSQHQSGWPKMIVFLQSE